MIGAKWLRKGNTDGRNPITDETWNINEKMNQDPQNQEENMHERENHGSVTTNGVNEEFLNEAVIRKDNIQSNLTKKGVTVIESKKRRTGDTQDCGLIDLGMEGCPYTWERGHGTEK